MKVIVISGKAGHGKDTVASILKEQMETDGSRVLITHYADLLKYVCRTFFGWDGEKDASGRRILQYVGTDVVREKKPDFWVNFLVDILSLFRDKWDYVLIPDCRFPNELYGIKEAGFDVIHLRVIRRNFASPLTPEQQAHPSETAMDNERPDYCIDNSFPLAALRRRIFELLHESNGRHQTGQICDGRQIDC